MYRFRSFCEGTSSPSPPASDYRLLDEDLVCATSPNVFVSPDGHVAVCTASGSLFFLRR